MTTRNMILMRKRALLAVAGAVTATTFLGGAMFAASPRFYSDDPVASEADTENASSVQPWKIDLFYDSIENMFGAPGDPTPNVPAMNVNTIGEVPDSSWFTNRIGSRPLTPVEVAKGPDVTSGPAAGKWTVLSAKSDGITPGFTITDTTGETWFIKFDPPGYRAMATGTEVTVTKLMWALGYYVPENRIAKLRREDLVVGEGATISPPGASKRAMEPDDLNTLLKRASREPDGSYRVVASKGLRKALGGFRFYGTRPDDPNDVVPHEHRRELRGYKIFAAWVNHVDSKSINSQDVLLSDRGSSFVRHYLLDFGSTLGSAAVYPREYWEGYEHLYEGGGQIAAGIPTLGFYVRPWRTVKVFESPSIGRLPLDNAAWDPESWKPRFSNAAFNRMRADDAFWAARKLAAMADDLIRAAVGEGQFGDERSEAFLVKALIDRRDAIVRTYLPAVNPVVDPELRNGTLTFANAAVDAHAAQAPEGYAAIWSRFDNTTEQANRLGETSGTSSSIQAPSGLPSEPGAFVKVDISAKATSHPWWARPVAAYFRRADGGGGWKLVGLDRMPDSQPAHGPASPPVRSSRR